MGRCQLVLCAILCFLQCPTSTSSSEKNHRVGPSEAVLKQRFHHVFRQGTKLPPWKSRGRRIEDAADYNDDQEQQQGDDDDNYDDDAFVEDNELCSQYLVSFLEGTTDARDTCEGIMNAYVAADCSSQVTTQGYSVYTATDDLYFQDFAEHHCCQALMAHHAEYCEEDNLLSNIHLLVAASVLLLCECAKTLVHKYGLHFLPEAATCILVGTMCGLCSHLVPGTSINDLSFDAEFFLSILLPPIILEAALSVSKSEFKRRRGAILALSVFGTIISTFSTGLMVHYVSKASSATTFPMLDSLVFGALISSIDPVAILSVLTSLHLDQKDTIFILVFGESLLNDGIAITVFQTLVNRFDGRTNDSSTSFDEVLDAVANFLIAMFGSLSIGLACGVGAWGYFFLLKTNLSPVMEVGSFFLWALIPYYICEGLGMSGIVGLVCVAFFMDIYVAGSKTKSMSFRGQSFNQALVETPRADTYRDMDEKALVRCESTFSIEPLPSTERIHLSATADNHVRFVAHLTSQLAENAIFAYLGLFLFSNTYDWNPTLVSISIFSCVMSRALMVVVVSFAIFQIYKCRGKTEETGTNSSKTARAIKDKRTQLVLVLAGLRGAVSLALVENVPIYNNVTGEGCEFKQLMKGMTSASILFTTFVFGGGAYYILPYLGIQPHESTPNPSVVTASGVSA